MGWDSQAVIRPRPIAITYMRRPNENIELLPVNHTHKDVLGQCWATHTGSVKPRCKDIPTSTKTQVSYTDPCKLLHWTLSTLCLQQPATNIPKMNSRILDIGWIYNNAPQVIPSVSNLNHCGIFKTLDTTISKTTIIPEASNFLKRVSSQQYIRSGKAR